MLFLTTATIIITVLLILFAVFITSHFITLTSDIAYIKNNLHTNCKKCNLK